MLLNLTREPLANHPSFVNRAIVSLFESSTIPLVPEGFATTHVPRKICEELKHTAQKLCLRKKQGTLRFSIVKNNSKYMYNAMYTMSCRQSDARVSLYGRLYPGKVITWYSDTGAYSSRCGIFPQKLSPWCAKFL